MEAGEPQIRPHYTVLPGTSALLLSPDSELVLDTFREALREALREAAFRDV